MEWRARETVTQPTELRFKNYEKVWILLVTNGTYEFLYKREKILPSKSLRHTLNLAITIGGGAVLYIAYFLLFEYKRCFKWFKNKTGRNSQVTNVDDWEHKTEVQNEDVDIDKKEEDAGIGESQDSIKRIDSEDAVKLEVRRRR